VKKYDTYKESGIEWIGKIPEHWEVSQLGKKVVKLTNGFVGSVRDIMQHEGVPYIQGIHIKNMGIQFTPKGKFYVSQEWSNAHQKSILKEKDVLFVQTGEIGKVGMVPSDFDGANCHALIITRPNNKYLISEYLLYFFNSSIGHYCLNRIRTGEILHHINGSKLKSVEILIPSLKEQTQIADYLDRKTTEIDQLIADKKALVELYKEEKTAIINQAVTKGINPDAKMKDSGTEWLGEIPEHWEVKKLKYVILDKLKYGANEPALESKHEHPRYIRITDFGKNGKLRGDTFKSLSPEKSKDFLLNDGDILFARSGATVGKTFQFKDYKGKSCFAGYLIKASPNRAMIESDFLFYFTQSGTYENWKNSVFIQATIQNIGADKYSLLELGVPPSIEEQKEIIEHINSESQKIDERITRKIYFSFN